MYKLSQIIQKYRNARIAVIGDLCLDMYYFLSEEKSEISVETGHRTQSVSKFASEAGGAGNVAINLKALGALSVDAYGVIGADPFGLTLESILSKEGVNCDNVLIQENNWNTHVYHKFFRNRIEEPRCDIGNFNKVSDTTILSLLNNFESKLSSYDAIIINEQIAHGYHNTNFQVKLSAIIEQNKSKYLWITDCRHLNSRYNHTIRKLNIHEARAIFTEANVKGRPLSGNIELLNWLYAYWKKPLVITLGEDGAIAIDDKGNVHEINGVNIIGQMDTVGAGDAFLSAFALSLATGGEMSDALNTGNLAAAVSVTKLFQTGHPSVDEIIEMGKSTDYRYNPEIAADIRKAEFLDGTSIEKVGIKKTGYPRVAIFDHDGTISTLRHGWEPIMKEVCMNAILGSSIDLASIKELDKVSNAVDDMIEKTTGVQTIIQMHHLSEMVRSFGLVPENEVLSPIEYKKIYNDKLLDMVSGRVELFKKGLLSVDDVTMKGALTFLEHLKKRGVLIYLASGTDMSDVQREASILGYDSYFNGGIFGSVGNTSSDPKRGVIETIIKSLPDDINAEDCYVFGDGPVEMREAAKREFTRIGMVSDERQRWGINNEKRSRLILGGAQVLIPDFSWIPKLAADLGWEDK
ncbi:MAG TPA: carbohydrate kinase [Spirochaeta sp.]|nr:carbohydrate kinase [Spirochaeta sp.]